MPIAEIETMITGEDLIYAVKNYANGKSWRHGILDWRIPRRYVFNFRALFLKRSCGKDFCKTLRGGDLKGFACETFLKDAFGGLCGTLGKPFAFTLSSIDRTYAQDICFAWSQDTELAGARTLAPELADVLAVLSLMSTLGRVHEKECLTSQQFKS